MKEKKFEFDYIVYESIKDMPAEQQALLVKAQEATGDAYAPYSEFCVGAAARLANGEILTGSNQENASYPAGICAERVLLSAAAAVFPKIPVMAIAITYKSTHLKSDHPIAPCGICRQTLQEAESRLQHGIQLILAGLEGEVYVIENASALLPLAFTKEELG